MSKFDNKISNVRFDRASEERFHIHGVINGTWRVLLVFVPKETPFMEEEVNGLTITELHALWKERRAAYLERTGV